MMKTRRSRKAATAAAAEAGSSSDVLQPSDDSRFTISIPDDLDIDALSSLVAEVDFSSPSTETIMSVYRLLVQQATDLNATQRELDEARAEAEKKDIELDQALQDRESMSKDLEQTLESAQTDLKKAKQERDQLGTSFITRRAFPSWDLKTVHLSHFACFPASSNYDARGYENIFYGGGGSVKIAC